MIRPFVTFTNIHNHCSSNYSCE